MADEAVLERLSEDVIGAMRGYVSRSLGPLLQRLEALEKRAPEKGERGDDGKDGPSADEIASLLRAAVATIPLPKDGKDGKSVDVAAISEQIVQASYAAAKTAVEAIPKPKDGKDGIDGKDFDPLLLKAELEAAVAKIPKPADGKDGKDFDPAALEPIVQRHLAVLPKPSDGKDGRDGRDADEAAVTKAVLLKVSEVLDSIPIPKDGRDGKDGIGVKGDKGDPGEPARFLVSEGPPLMAGKAGEVYLDASNGDIYRCA